MLEEFGTDVRVKCCVCHKTIKKKDAELIRVEVVDKAYLKKGENPVSFQYACGPKDWPHQPTWPPHPTAGPSPKR